MKAFICVISALLLLSVAGCGKDAVPTETEASPQTTAVTSQTTTTAAVSTTENVTETTAEKLPPLQNLLNSVYEAFGSEQIILAYQISEEEPSKGRVCTFEKNEDGTFVPVNKDIEVVFGKNGLNKEMEGDKKAPSGIFHIPFAFGRDDIAHELNIEYRVATGNDYWVDDVDSEDYNTWQTFEGNPEERWKSFERLNISSYRLAFVIDYNPERIKGDGSAIFFHVWKDPDTYTSGCTATDEDSLLMIIKWLDNEKNPVIIQGSLMYYSVVYGLDILKEIEDDAF